MAGLKGKNGPPGNMNAFKHGLAIQKRRAEDVPTKQLDGLWKVLFGASQPSKLFNPYF